MPNVLMVSQRRLAFAASALLFVGFAAGCSPKQEETPTPPDTAPQVTQASPSPEASPSPDASPSTVAGPPAPSASPAMGGFDTRPFSAKGKKVKTASGLEYEEMTPGTGSTPKSGQFVSVHYTGTLESGEEFDSSRKRGQPIEFPLGQHAVIPGWDEGIAQMKVGGRRKLYIPGSLAYGANPPPGAPIPPNATLVFDVELMGASDTKTQSGGM